MQPPTMMIYTVVEKEGDTTTVLADTFGLADGWFMFMKQNFTKDFGIVMTAITAFRQEEVKYISGKFAPPAKESGIDLVTQ